MLYMYMYMLCVSMLCYVGRWKRGNIFFHETLTQRDPRPEAKKPGGGKPGAAPLVYVVASRVRDPIIFDVCDEACSCLKCLEAARCDDGPLGSTKPISK